MLQSIHAKVNTNKHNHNTAMPPRTNYPFGVPPPFGPPPSSTNSNNNNAAPAAAESPSSIDSDLFADIDVIICGIKEDIGALLSSLQQYARKRGDAASEGLSVALDVRYHLQGQQDLDGCCRFIREHGREMQEFAGRVFAGDAARWAEDGMDDGDEESEEGVQGGEEGGDGAGEEDGAGGQEMLAEGSEVVASEEDGEEYVASEEDSARVQWMEAHEAMEVVRRLETLQDNLLRDIPLLSEEERAHKTTLSHQMIGDHWYELVETRLKGERHW